MNTINEIPRILNKSNIDQTIKAYTQLLDEIPLKIEETNVLDLLQKLKREKMGSGPWSNVSIFEAANRIMSDLVILYGVKRIFDGEFPHLEIFKEFEVELGNENKKEHDIISIFGNKRLIGEAFNVAPSFFNIKKNKMIKKLTDSNHAADYMILLCNADSHEVTKSKIAHNVEIIKVYVKI